MLAKASKPLPWAATRGRWTNKTTRWPWGTMQGAATKGQGPWLWGRLRARTGSWRVPWLWARRRARQAKPPVRLPWEFRRLVARLLKVPGVLLSGHRQAFKRRQGLPWRLGLTRVPRGS